MSALLFTVLLILAVAAGVRLNALAHRAFENHTAQDVIGGIAALVPLAALLAIACS